MPSSPKKAPTRSKKSPKGKQQVDRLATLSAVILCASYLGAEEAIKRFGANLLAGDKRTIRKVTNEEWRVLRNVKKKLPAYVNFV